MVKDTRLDFVMFYEKIPVMDRVKKLAASGIAPGGAHRNLEFVRKKVAFPEKFLKEEKIILSDPQTSGGLLIALSQKGLNKFDRLAKKEKIPLK